MLVAGHLLGGCFKGKTGPLKAEANPFDRDFGKRPAMAGPERNKIAKLDTRTAPRQTEPSPHLPRGQPYLWMGEISRLETTVETQCSLGNHHSSRRI